MKLHPNGSIEGTPQEIAEYNKLQEKKPLFKYIKPNITSDSIDARYPGSGIIYVSTEKPKVSMDEYPSLVDYVNGLLGVMTNKGNLH